jgi:hypothetical protein
VTTDTALAAIREAIRHGDAEIAEGQPHDEADLAVLDLLRAAEQNWDPTHPVTAAVGRTAEILLGEATAEEFTQ